MGSLDYKSAEVLFRVRCLNWVLTLCICFISLILSLACQISVKAQNNPLQVGDRVRITAPIVERERIKGKVMEIDEAVLVLSVKGSAFYVSESLIQKMEISTGKRRTMKNGILIGAFTGTLVFGLMSVYTNNACGFGKGCIVPKRNGDLFLTGAAVGVIIGGTAGAITGFFIKIDRWERIPVSVAMELTPVSSFNNPQTVEPKISVRLSLR